MSFVKSSTLPPSHHRFVVNSAEEAVKLIRQKLGDKAHVISVNQVNGKGLARFLKAPKLEVIAALAPEKEPFLQPKAPKLSEEKTVEPFQRCSELISFPKDLPRQESLIYKHYQTSEDVDFNLFLKKAGFSERMIYHFQSKTAKGRGLSSLRANEPLKEMVQFLIHQYQGLTRLPLGKRVAFLGSAGVGKSTLLCKQLAKDVFIHQTSPSVLKLDHVLPHSNEALSVFCKALGVPCIKASSLGKIEGGPFYVDMSGPSLKDKNTWDLLGQKLNTLALESKVWVIQAAYDEELILENLHLAQKLGATHLAFTHLDEVYRFNKLWDSLIFSGLSPALFSYGQGVSGEATSDILQFLLAKTFPYKVLEDLSYSEGGGSAKVFVQN